MHQRDRKSFSFDLQNTLARGTLGQGRNFHCAFPISRARLLFPTAGGGSATTWGPHRNTPAKNVPPRQRSQTIRRKHGNRNREMV